MCELDEGTRTAFLDKDSVCAVVYSLIGRRVRSIDLYNAEIPGDLIYIGMTSGKDSEGEFFGPYLKIDNQ